jgi:hypothetical protein
MAAAPISTPTLKPIDEAFQFPPEYRGRPQSARDEHQPLFGVERHRVPAMRAARPRHLHHRLAGERITRVRIDVGPAGLGIDAPGPGDRRVILGRDELAVGTIDHVEEAVLRRVHQHFTRLAIDREIGEHDMLAGSEIPAFGRRLLEVPGIGAGLGLQRDHRREIEIVAAARRADLLVPGGSVADTDIEQVEIGIVGHRIPHGAAAAELPIFAGPGLGGLLQIGRLGALRGIARHGVEAPELLAALGIVSGDIAAHAIFGAAIADDDAALDDARRAGDSVGLGLIDRHHRPGGLARGGIERDQPAVERADIDLVAPRRDAAIDGIAARLDQRLARHLGIVGPEQFAGARVERLDHAPGGADEELAVDHQRRGFLPARGIEIRIPGEAELGGIGGVDLRERGETLFVIAAPGGEPLVGIASSGDDTLGRDARRCRARCRVYSSKLLGPHGRNHQCSHRDRRRITALHSHLQSPQSCPQSRYARGQPCPRLTICSLHILRAYCAAPARRATA